MSICVHLSDNCVSEPGAIQALATAYELSCADLEIFAEDQRGREIIATRIIDLARNGVINAAALHKVINAAALHKRVMAEARVSA